MTKAELVTAVHGGAKTDGMSKAAVGDVIDAVFDALGKAIKKDGWFAVPRFGTFTVKKRAARKGRNPRTGAALKIKASKTVGFQPAPTLKQGL